MSENLEKITYFAETDHRGKQNKFGIKAVDRMKHMYVIGKTGMGKSTLLENMAAQDIKNGNGIAFIDPHGSTAEKLLDYVPKERIEDVIYFAPFDIDHPISFNVMEDVGYDKRHLVASGLMSAFRKIWKDAWSARMEYILQNTLLALLEYPDATILGVNRMLINKEFRKKVVEHITDPVVKSFWSEEFASFTDTYAREATPAIQNKIGQFVSNPLIRNMVGQPNSSFDFRKAMDDKKIIIINLSKGRMGDTNAQLIGSMLIIKIYLAAMSRADTTPGELAGLPNFYFFVDEFQAFANETFADILSESRKYKLSLTIAHQYIEQMPEEVRDAVFGNVGTLTVFRVGAFDAEVLEKEFAPVFTAEDIVNLGFAQIYLKLMIDGLASRPFSAVTLPPLPEETQSHKDEIIAYSRKEYARDRSEVEKLIKEHNLPPKKEVPDRSADNASKSRAPSGDRSRERGRWNENKDVSGRNSTVRRDYTDSRGTTSNRDTQYNRVADSRSGIDRRVGDRRQDERERRPVERSGMESGIREERRGAPVREHSVPNVRRVVQEDVPRDEVRREDRAPHHQEQKQVPPPLGHSSLKAALGESLQSTKTDDSEAKKVSLEAIERMQRNKKGGIGSSENKNTLRSALAEALGNKDADNKTKDEVSKKTNNQPQKTEQKESKNEEQLTKPQPAIPETAPETEKKEKKIPEIPENKLREMLRVEE